MSFGRDAVGRKLKDQVTEHITAVHELVQKLSQAKDFEEALRIQNEFMHTQLGAFGEQATSLAEACPKVAADAAKKPSFLNLTDGSVLREAT